eukprot:3302220-Prymnesium_polylepis.1
MNDSWWLRLGAKPAFAPPLAVCRSGSSALPAVASRTHALAQLLQRLRLWLALAPWRAVRARRRGAAGDSE